MSFKQTELSNILNDRLSVLKSKGLISNEEGVCIGVSKYSLVSGDIYFECFPDLYTKNKDRLQQHFIDIPNLFRSILAVIVHAYTYKDEDYPEYIIIQQRGSKVSSGKNKIQSAAAGSLEFGEHPTSAALREFNEEVGLSAEFADYRSLGLFHFNVGANLPNTICLNYILKIKTSAANFSVVNNLDEFLKLEQSGNSEVSRIALVPFYKFNKFWNECLVSGQVYDGPDGVFGRSIKPFLKLFRQT